MIEIIIILILVIAIYIGFRNNMVYSYLTNLNHRCANACRIYLLSNEYTEDGFIKKRDMYESIMSRLSYNKLVFSFKKLNDENILTDEELDFLNESFTGEDLDFQNENLH